MEDIGDKVRELLNKKVTRREFLGKIVTLSETAIATGLVVGCIAPFVAAAKPLRRQEDSEPIPTDEEITFTFGEDVPEHLQNQIRTTSVSVLGWFSDHGVYIGGADIFAYNDPNTTVDKYLERSPQIPVSEHQNLRQNLSRATAFTGFNRDLFIITSSPGWLSASPIIGGPASEGRDHTLAHEFMHVFQREVGAYNQEPTAWLNEGCAHYIAARFLEEKNIYPYDTIRNGHISEASKMRELLQTLESYQTFSSAGSPFADEYSLAFLGVEYLVKDLPDSGILAIVDYWRKIGQGNLRQSAFEDAFGKKQEIFYSEFESFRQQGFK